MKGRLRIALTVLVFILLIVTGFLWRAGYLNVGAPSRKITIASVPSRNSGLVYLAEARGYFKAQGLDLTLTTDASALESIRDLNSGRVDLACCGAFDFVQDVFGGASKPRCLSVLAKGQIFSVIARPDQGVTRPEDLRGKTIGTIGGTAAEFFLARFLIMHQIPYKEVTVVDLPPAEMAGALAAGRVDAVMLPDRTFYSVKQVLGDRALVWPAQAGQDIYWLMLTRQDFLQSQPRVLKKLLVALHQAAVFYRDHTPEARALIAQKTGFPLACWDDFPMRYELFLDLGLLLALEDQAAWLIDQRPAHRTAIPDFLDYLDPGPLLAVNPRAVRMVLPGRELPK